MLQQQHPEQCPGMLLLCVHNPVCCTGVTAQVPRKEWLNKNVKDAIFQAGFFCLAKIPDAHTPGHAHWKVNSEAIRGAALGIFLWQDTVTKSLSKPSLFFHPILTQTLQNTHFFQLNQPPLCQQQKKTPTNQKKKSHKIEYKE